MLAYQEYSPEYLVEMSSVFSKNRETLTIAVEDSKPCHILTENEAAELIAKSRFGGIGLPQLVRDLTFASDREGGDQNV